MCAQDGYTSLMYAAETGSAPCVAAILDVDGIDVHAQDKVRHSVDNHTCLRALRPRQLRELSWPRCKSVLLQSAVAEVSYVGWHWYPPTCVR